MNPSPPVVFVGPSCPISDVRTALPDAVIVPPVGRGDLYRYRLLQFSHFVVLDGVFTNAPAVSPREVVDVLRDGAVVVGASSMGALRATDCAPAGAIGYGTVFRLFRRRVLSSEDEVAVAFRADQPFPPLSEPLVNIRIALRRAERIGMLTRSDADAVFRVARALPYHRRTWKSVLGQAGVALHPDRIAMLKSWDAKRADAVGCCRWVAQALTRNRLQSTPSRSRDHLFGLRGHGREAPADALDGAEFASIQAEFAHWLALSGQIAVLHGIAQAEAEAALDRRDVDTVTARLQAVRDAPEFDGLLMRFTAFRRACWHCADLDLRPTAPDLARAGNEIAQAHRAPSWNALLDIHGDRPLFRQMLGDHRDQLAAVLRLKSDRLFRSSSDDPGAGPLTWTRATHL